MAELFPDFEDDLEEFAPDEDLEESADILPAQPYGFTWRFDLAAGDIMLDDGGNALTVEGIGTVMEWINHTLGITRFETSIYGTDIGTDLNSLIGSKEDEYILARSKREITEALLKHDRITEVEVTEVFTIAHALYALVEFSTDDEERASALFLFDPSSS